MFAITRFRYIEVLSIYFNITGVKKSFVIPRTSLYRGSLYRSSTVLRSTGKLGRYCVQFSEQWDCFGVGEFDQFPAQPRNRKSKEAAVSQ